MFLSIIVPVYNAETYICECLNSLIEQNIPQDDYEILCVNDGSTDTSLQILTAYAESYPNITVIDKENCAFAPWPGKPTVTASFSAATSLWTI